MVHLSSLGSVSRVNTGGLCCTGREKRDVKFIVARFCEHQRMSNLFTSRSCLRALYCLQKQMFVARVSLVLLANALRALSITNWEQCDNDVQARVILIMEVAGSCHETLDANITAGCAMF